MNREGLAIHFRPQVGPFFDQLFLLAGQLCEVKIDYAVVDVSREVGLIIRVGGVAAAGTGNLFTGKLEFRGGQHVEERLGQFGMRAVLDHGGGKAADGVAFLRPYNMAVVGAAHQQGDRAVVVGQAHGVFTVVNALIDGG